MIESVVEERSKDVLILNQQKDFISHFYKYGFVGVMLDWIDSGIDEDYQMILDDLEMTVLEQSIYRNKTLQIREV